VQNPPSQLHLPKTAQSDEEVHVVQKGLAALLWSSNCGEEGSCAKGDMKTCLGEEREAH